MIECCWNGDREDKCHKPGICWVQYRGDNDFPARRQCEEHIEYERSKYSDWQSPWIDIYYDDGTFWSNDPSRTPEW